MFFKKPFKVAMNGRAGISYREGELIINIDSEMLNGSDFDMVVFLENQKKWRIDGDVILDDHKIQLIKSRIRQEFRKVRVDWQ